jgi:transposase
MTPMHHGQAFSQFDPFFGQPNVNRASVVHRALMREIRTIEVSASSPSAPSAPATRVFSASGETDRAGRISKCGDGLVRTYLVEAAGVLMTLRTGSASDQTRVTGMLRPGRSLVNHAG